MTQLSIFETNPQLSASEIKTIIEQLLPKLERNQHYLSFPSNRDILIHRIKTGKLK